MKKTVTTRFFRGKLTLSKRHVYLKCQ